MSENVKYRGLQSSDNNKALTETTANYGSSGSGLGQVVLDDLTCDSTVFVGAVVRMNGTTVVNALANNKSNSEVLGICISKSDATTCDVQVAGVTENIYGGLSIITSYYLSDVSLGQITTIPPTTSGAYVIRIGRSQNAQNLVVQNERIVKRG